MLLDVWRLATRIAAPLVRVHLQRRRRRGKEHPERWPERLAVDATRRPPGRLVWLHAASVGESLSILPLLDGLIQQRPDLRFLVTTGTVTSAALMAKRLPDGVLHRFAPVDLPDVVERFLDRWRPDLAMMVESELWPNILATLARRAVPTVLVNARMSERSFRRWRLAGSSIAALLGSFRLVLAQSQADAGRLTALGAGRVVTPGNLKYAAPPLPADEDELAALRTALDGRPAWLAASTHDGEELAAGQVHRALKSSFPDLVTVVVPRHPDRGQAIAQSLVSAGLPVAQRSAGQPPRAGAVYVADTLGELGLFYRACPLVFVGGSLVRHGGQNPLEPARLGCAVLLGPHVWNFDEIARGMIAGGAAVQVENEAALAEQVGRLLANPDRVEAVGQTACRFAEERAGVLERMLAALAPVLPGPL
ncbi:MAG TPA: 3-deoxy-D-manno-octulosonic acid transferase [Geminicoccus sp.]|uniref:3-deoxy-D-manno-octulosonic acid transferase n=1 Tax=Geminicoccus sp. TaxID=2024832 RepID=UPI002CD99932|nr:3-deoxy-D-manno-octulosonic acid transferase [Geminicoccus sp.]HWL69870.1 3-deoxy-D-manno-octulosonic acid transferase [Geminicoccus sp.]